METPAHQYSLLKPPAWLERLNGRSLAVGAVAAFVPFGLLLAMERFFPAYAVQFLYTGMALSALLGVFRVAYFWRHRRHTEFDKDLQNIIICAAGGTFTYRLVALRGPRGYPHRSGHVDLEVRQTDRHARAYLATLAGQGPPREKTQGAMASARTYGRAGVGDQTRAARCQRGDTARSGP